MRSIKKIYFYHRQVLHFLQDINEGLDDQTLIEIIDEVDLSQNGKLELDEFLEVIWYFKLLFHRKIEFLLDFFVYVDEVYS